MNLHVADDLELQAYEANHIECHQYGKIGKIKDKIIIVTRHGHFCLVTGLFSRQDTSVSLPMMDVVSMSLLYCLPYRTSV